ncbi:MAG: hypothetical protein ABIY48_03820 [Acidimicrobiales bacterium]
MSPALLSAYVAAQAWWVATPARLRRDERGEGVISAAIAVLIMAGIGALMWVGFKSIWQDTETNTKDKVAEIGD